MGLQVSSGQADLLGSDLHLEKREIRAIAEFGLVLGFAALQTGSHVPGEGEWAAESDLTLPCLLPFQDSLCGVGHGACR